LHRLRSLTLVVADYFVRRGTHEPPGWLTAISKVTGENGEVRRIGDEWLTGDAVPAGRYLPVTLEIAVNHPGGSCVPLLTK
jgi:hypothetical protein